MTRAMTILLLPFLLGGALAACSGDVDLRGDPDKVWLQHRIPSK